MNSVVTKYPVEIVTDEKVEEIGRILVTGKMNSERAGTPNSILDQYITIDYFTEYISIMWRDFHINVPHKWTKNQ